MGRLPRYLLADWDPESGASMAAWARRMADEGWETWAGAGCWTSINGQRVWRVSLRHRDDRPRRLIESHV